MTLRPVGVQMTADGAAAFNRAMADGDKAIAGFGKSATEASSKVSGFSQIATGALRQVGAIAVNALADAGRAFVGFVGESVKKAGDFEAGMNEFGAVTGSALKDSGKSLKDFSSLFIQLGRDLPVSTKDVQNAAIELAKGGIDPATIAAGALRTSLNLAAAGGVGLADSANILSKQLGVWVDSAASAQDKSAFLAETADLLSQAANVTTSDVGDMAIGLAQVGGVAKVAGLSFHETVQTMAELAPSFSSASDAGTSLKTFLTRLQPTTKPAIAAMSDLGLYTKAAGSAFYDAEGKFVGMDKASALLQAATSGLTEAQRLLAFQTIFGTDAIRAAAIIADKGAAGYAEMGKQMDAAGTVASQAAARQQGLNTAWENAQGSIEALQLTVGAALIPMLTTLLNTVIAPAINSVTAFADAFFSAGDKMGFLTTAIDGMLPGFGSLVSWLQVQIPLAVTTLTDIWNGTLLPGLQSVGAVVTGTIVPALISVNTWVTTNVASWGQIATAVVVGVAAFQTLGTVVGVVTGVAGAFGVLTAAIAESGSVLGGIVAVLGGPVTVAIGAVALAAGALYLAWNTNFLGIRDTLSSWWTSSGQPIFNELRTWLSATLVSAAQTLASFWTGTLQPALAAVWSFVQSNVIPILSSLASGALPAVGVAATTLAHFWTGTLQPALSAVWSFVQTNVIPILSSLASGAMVALGTAATVLAGFWTNTLLPAITGVWSFIQTSLVPLFQAVAGVEIAALNLALTALAGIWDKVLLPAITSVASFLSATLQPVITSVADFFTNTFSPNVSAAGDALSTVLGPAITAVTGFFNTWYTAIGGVSGAIKTVIGWLNDLKSALQTIHLPDWMTPGSPTPWEIGLWGVSRAMKQVAGSDLPLLTSNLQRVNRTFDGTAKYTQSAGAQAGAQFISGMSLGVLKSMPDLLAAMRTSTDSGIQEILGEIDENLRSGQSLGIFSQSGADTMNAFIMGMQQQVPGFGVALGGIRDGIRQLFTPPDTHGLIDALAAVKGTVTDLGALLNGNSTGNGSIEGDTKETFTSIVDLTHQAWEQVRVGISTAVIDARATVDTATKAILQVSTDSFTKLRATSDLAWGQIHKGITDQITLTQQGVKLSTDTMMKGTTDTFNLLQSNTTRIFGQMQIGITGQMTRTQAGVKLSTDAMQKGATATWGLMGADAAVGWQKVKANIETPVNAAKDTVATASAAMQQKLVIPPETQDAVFQTYRHVTDTMIAQLEKVTTQIDNVTEAWGRLSRAKGPQGPTSSDLPSGYGGGRAGGGSVLAGMAYTVGELGRELFVPQTSGSILPANTTSQLLAGMNQRISPPASAQQITNSAVYNQQQTTMFNLTAQYQYQAPRSLAQDVRTLQMLYPST